MTKIAISPNVNGTGTFTLAAPDSNTNRTLTLPDAGGEVFSQGNALGTVSQSSGVPTGAIIQRGSNANGEFVRFADGTQICTLLQLTLTQSFDDRLDATWTYPAAFASGPSVNFNGLNALSSNNDIRLNVSYFGTISNPTATSAVPMLRLISSVANPGDTANARSLVAIGRWF